uniref:Uncharacterized protein n=1 Tax=Opuntia streptacantha TaxID=393608 RepID=A0A7C9B304_OPUST
MPWDASRSISCDCIWLLIPQIRPYGGDQSQGTDLRVDEQGGRVFRMTTLRHVVVYSLAYLGFMLLLTCPRIQLLLCIAYNMLLWKLVSSSRRTSPASCGALASKVYLY